MRSFLITLAIIGGLFIAVCLVAAIVGFIQRWLHPDGYESSSEEVRAQLQKIIDGTDSWALDDFISIGPLKDPRLEAIRQRCARLDEEFPPESKGQYCGPKGIEVIQEFIRDLEDKPV